MHILVTNDDGVLSPGIMALAAALRRLGSVTVLAPDHNWSAAGHNKTMHKPLRVESRRLADGSPALSSNGTPSDCVALAVLGVVPEKIDLVVSGINAGPNLGQDITYSGTVAGAMEATINGLPAMAVSLACFDSDAGYDTAAEMAASVAEVAMAVGLPEGTFLNVNVPPGSPAEVRGVCLTRLGRRVYRDVLLERKDPRGRPYYWIGGDPPGGEPEPDTDIWAVENGLVSVTPIHMDMTAYRVLENAQAWQDRLTGALRRERQA